MIKLQVCNNTSIIENMLLNLYKWSKTTINITSYTLVAVEDDAMVNQEKLNSNRIKKMIKLLLYKLEVVLFK